MPPGIDPKSTPPWISGDYPTPSITPGQLPRRPAPAPGPDVEVRRAILGDGVTITAGHQTLTLDRRQWETWTRRIRNGDYDDLTAARDS